MQYQGSIWAVLCKLLTLQWPFCLSITAALLHCSGACQPSSSVGSLSSDDELVGFVIFSFISLISYQAHFKMHIHQELWSYKTIDNKCDWAWGMWAQTKPCHIIGTAIEYLWSVTCTIKLIKCLIKFKISWP